MKIKEFNDEVVFLHEVVLGAADRSYGIHVAKLAGLPNVVIKRAEQVLNSLENDKKSNNIRAMADDLPLFANVKAKIEKDEKPSALEEFVNSINPDDLSPKDALEKLYEICNLKK